MKVLSSVVRFLSLLLLAIGVSGCMVQPLLPVQEGTAPSSSSSAAPTESSPPRPSARAASEPASLSARPATSAAPATSAGITQVRGEFSYTNDIITSYYVEQAVALQDMYGFVIRDREWELPLEGQTLGYLKLDQAAQRGSYTLQLPAQPRGTAVDVDNDADQDAGVQIFAVSYAPNITGGPFSEGDDQSSGWPSYLASTVNDPENDDEVTGGKLIVWAPDDQQQFPSGFGDDGLLFTQDDPVAPLPAGYSVIDLDQQTFAVSQQADQELTLHEPEDAGVKDYSNLSYSEAFTNMFERIRREYAFNGVAGKEPNWDALYNELMPRVTEAEQQRDDKAFFQAVWDFTQAFNDGHVGLSGGDEYIGEIARATIIGGYGLAIRELDDKRVIATFVLEDGPAANAGITVGTEITRWNDQPIGDAISAVTPLGGPYSTDFAKRYDQQQFLVRAPIDTKVTVTFINNGAPAQTATLTAVDELDSLYAFENTINEADPNGLPVDFRILPSGAGYIRLNSNYDDLNLIIRLFERALSTFDQNQVSGLILDLRRNGGGAPLGLAGYLLDQEIEIAQLEYFSEKTGTFEPEGTPRTIEPYQRQFSFPKTVLLVDKNCASACEIEAYGFSQVPGIIVMGQYPTAGVEAEVSRGQYKLPEDLSLQVPTGRFVLPDGSIFLEGKGVQPTRRVPIDEQTALSSEDVVLQAAEQAISGE